MFPSNQNGVPGAILIVQSNPQIVTAFFLNLELRSSCLRQLNSDFPEYSPTLIVHMDHNALFPELHVQTACVA